MSPARNPRGGQSKSLFEDTAPRPLADKLRPQKLSDVVGQDHLLGAGCAHRAHGRGASPVLDDPVGSARLRQDHDRAPARRDHRHAFRAALGGVLGRRRSAQSVRGRDAAPRRRPGHAALHRRDPSLQPRPAGRLPALRRGRHCRAGRRHHGESRPSSSTAPCCRAARSSCCIASTMRRSKPC